MGTDDRLGGNQRKMLNAALRDRPDVGIVQEERRGQKVTLWRRLGTEREGEEPGGEDRA